MAKFSNAKIGQDVFSSVYGEGHIINVYDKGDTPIQVKFKYCIREFTVDGFEATSVDYIYPTLFWNEFDIPTNEEDTPLDLIELLEGGASCIDFVDGEKNYFIYYDELNKCFRYAFSVHENYITTVYLDSGNFDFLVNMLNGYKITPKQLKNAFEELGWL